MHIDDRITQALLWKLPLGVGAVTVFEKDKNMVWRQIGDETILVPVHRDVGDLDSVYTLNETAAFIWSQIDGILAVADIRDRLVAEFEVGQKQAQADLEHCLVQLQEIAAVHEAG